MSRRPFRRAETRWRVESIPPRRRLRHRIPGARAASPDLPPAAVGPVSVQRRVPVGGVVMVTRQRLRIGNAHAGKTVTIYVEDTHFRVVHNDEELSIHPRREQRPVMRWREQPPRPRT